MSEAGVSRTTALKFVVLLGVVSLFADMTYEGARSITGPFLALLGASVVGRAMLDAVGPMRDDYFLYCEEVEWCLRAKAAGLRFCPGCYSGLDILIKEKFQQPIEVQF